MIILIIDLVFISFW